MRDINSAGDLTRDSSELEALFDSIVSGKVVANANAPGKQKVPARDAATAQDNDSDDLQALFDSVAEKNRAAPAEDGSRPASRADTLPDWPTQEKVFHQVGQMTRQLHNTLGALGYDKLIEKTVSALPDAKDRLAYIANLTEQAACKVLNATDIANPLQDELEANAAVLGGQWDALFANQMGVDDFKRLAGETRAFVKTTVPQRTAATQAQLMEIMMAQDFQDLTG
ncbi:MAG: protein phosphatase CheZ, partial [Propionivibrio sp.]